MLIDTLSSKISSINPCRRLHAAADRSQANDPISLDSEMLVPFLEAGMKQRDELAVDVRDRCGCRGLHRP